jgi:hypothetical protein
MRMPSCAPLPVPTINAVGVARPRAQGQAMINTATAAVNAAAALSVAAAASQKPNVAGRRPWPGQRRARPAPPRRRAGRAANGLGPVEPLRRRSRARHGRRRLRHPGRVAGCLDLGDQVVGGDIRLGLDRRPFGGVVDGGDDTVELVQSLLDPGGARGARHAADIELDDGVVQTRLLHHVRPLSCSLAGSESGCWTSSRNGRAGRGSWSSGSASKSHWDEIAA